MVPHRTRVFPFPLSTKHRRAWAGKAATSQAEGQSDGRSVIHSWPMRWLAQNIDPGWGDDGDGDGDGDGE